MRYDNVILGRFQSRPNRFIAHVLVNGEIAVCHVKNTGRCRELFVPDARVVLAPGTNPARKTMYDVIAVYKGDKLINIDSQAPNQVFREWAVSGGFLPDAQIIRPEYLYGQSRLDFYVETKEKRCLVEVKGVTLEEEGIARFPDAPTERGVKHLTELAAAVRKGYECYAFFVIQMCGVYSFSPNGATDPAFAKALKTALDAGVHVLAYDCRVREDSLTMGEPVPVFV
jgi:sugar fermentation stimulation protein A